MLEQEIQRRARGSAVRWARWRLGPLGFSDLLTDVETSVLRYGRLITRHAVRTGAWREEASSPGASAPSGFRSPLSLEALDLWSGSPEELAQRSSHLADCRGCSGSGKTTCSSCRGSLRVACPGCGGDGKRMSRARKSYRMVNCSDCRGNGTKKCLRCTKGLVGCSPCRGSGAVRRWIHVTTAEHTQVRAWPDPKVLSAHPGLLKDSDQASHWKGAKLLASVDHPGRIPDAQWEDAVLSAGFASARASLEPDLDPLRGRILSQSLRVFEAPSATVRFEFAGASGFIRLLGNDLTPTASRDTAPFHRRFGALLGTFLAGLFGVSILFHAFIGRHAFYKEAQASAFAALVVMGLWPGTWWWMAAWLRRRRPGGAKFPARWHDRMGVGFTVICAVLFLGCFLFVRPSVSELARLTAAGDLRAAELHADLLESQGESSPAYVEARNAFVLARIQALKNREAVELIRHYSGSQVGTEPLETEARRLRTEWALLSLRQDDETSVEQELAALEKEGAPASDVNALRSRLEDSRVARGKALLATGDVERALRVLQRIKAPALASERPEPVLTRAFLQKERACPARDVRCRASALQHAVATDTGDSARTAMASFRVAELGRMRHAVHAPVGVGPALKELDGADEEAVLLLSVLGEDLELKQARQDLSLRREELLKGRFVLNEPVEVARALLSSSGLKEQKPGVLRVEAVPSGLLAYLFVDQGVVRGLYVTAAEHGTKALSGEALQQLVKRLTGQQFSDKDLVRSGAGVAHVPARLGRQGALLGWQDATLVEALIGKVDP